MFQPALGVSLRMLSENVTGDLLEAVDGSRIATLEIIASLIEESDRAREIALLQRWLARSRCRVMTIHATFGRAFDLSARDDETRQRALAAIHTAIDLAVDLEAPTIVVHASAEPVGDAERPQCLERARTALAEIGRRCRQAGKRVAVELLPRSCIGNTVEDLVQLLDGLDEDMFGVCLDTNHLMDRYRDLAFAVRTLGARLFTLHLSDYDGIDEKHDLPGMGVLDWAAFMGALRDVNYQGPFNYEAKIERETLPERIQALEANFDWLTGLAP